MDVAYGANEMFLSIPPVPRLRGHVPSQAERARSHQLIQQWKIHIESMKLSIQDAEEILQARQKSLDETYEAKIAAIRQELAMAKNMTNEQSKAYTEPLRVRLATTEKMLLLEEVFIANIRKIPDETLVEIFEWCLDGEPPTRKLALVCKSWKNLLLNTPSFWRNLEAFFVPIKGARYHAQILQRRISLSRSTLLNVTLSSANYIPAKQDQIDLFTLMSKTGLDRWKYLKIINGYSCKASAPNLEGVFQGSLSSLHGIEFTGSNYGPFLSIYTILQQSTPPIRELVCSLNGVPRPLCGSAVFQNVSKLDTMAQYLWQLPPLDNLQELKLTNVTRRQLESLQRNKLIHLELGRIESGPPIDLAFPELSFLSIRDDLLQSVTNILAPKLKTLNLNKLESPLRGDERYPLTLKGIRDEVQSITFKPTTLYINIGIPTKGLLALLID